MDLTEKRLNRAYENALCLPISRGSRIVLMSDCHRGIGNWGDNFQPNQNLFFAALQYYYRKNFTYIELGDGDELWENRNLKEILRTHDDQFRVMGEFYKRGRFHMIYGNHDRKKACQKYFRSHCHASDCQVKGQLEDMFPNMEVHEAIRLQEASSGTELLLVHGHQGDLWNDILWKLTRLLVRYLWRPLELAGCNDPTSAAKNYRRKEKTERRLSAWADRHGQILVAGHTHRPSFPQPGEGHYFNDGSCVHPRCITALELECGEISLVRWSVEVREDNILYVGREVLEGPRCLAEYARR
ncbi:MAG: serine/threonine protein phosphatase [Lachnospiraceae bacterium]|nr:serine/threonine protein phosphatase [Lachnospiraceae bacterium]